MVKRFLIGVVVLNALFFCTLPVFAAPIESTSAIPEPPLLRLQVPLGDITGFSKEPGGQNITAYLAIAYQWLIRAAVVLSVLMFIIAGFMWLTAGGESEQIKKSQEIIKNTLIGLMLAFGSYAILWNTNPKLVQPLNLRLDKIEGKELEIEKVPLTESCEEICKKTAEGKGTSWTSSGGTIDACTPPSETTVNQTVEACVKGAQLVCKCTFLVQTAGAPNCRTNGCGSQYFCDLPSNTCKDRLAENALCDLTISNHCADGLICKDVSGTKKCTRDVATTTQGTCCYHTYQAGQDLSGAAVDLPVAQGPTAMSQADCMAKGPTRATGTNKSWWFCQSVITPTESCGARRDLSAAYPSVTIPDGHGGFKAGTPTEWIPHAVSQPDKCVLFRYGTNPTLFNGQPVP
ncbi:MAG: pilin [Patescibacteria group bacterium]